MVQAEEGKGCLLFMVPGVTTPLRYMHEEYVYFAAVRFSQVPEGIQRGGMISAYVKSLFLICHRD